MSSAITSRSDGDGSGHQALLHVLGEQHELVAHLAGQTFGEPARNCGVDQADPGTMANRSFLAPPFDAFFLVGVV